MRKLSAYNRHMSKEMKKGKTFKQAVSSWKGSSSTKKRKKTRRKTVKRKTRRRVNTMPRRRRRTRRRVASSTFMNTILGGAAAGIIQGMVPGGNFGKVAAGYLAGRKGGLLGNTAKSLAVLGAANIAQQYAGGSLPMPSIGGQIVGGPVATSDDW